MVLDTYWAAKFLQDTGNLLDSFCYNTDLKDNLMSHFAGKDLGKHLSLGVSATTSWSTSYCQYHLMFWLISTVAQTSARGRPTRNQN